MAPHAIQTEQDLSQGAHGVSIRTGYPPRE